MTEEVLTELLRKAYLTGVDTSKRICDPESQADAVIKTIIAEHKDQQSSKFVPPILVPREQILLYYLQQHPKKCIKIETLDDLLNYMWKKLYDQGTWDKYTISYTVFLADILKMCAIYENMFYFDEFSGYIWGADKVIKKKSCDLDDNIRKIIDSFIIDRAPK